MSSIIRRSTPIIGGAIIAALLAGSLPTAATAAPAQPDQPTARSGFACGYDGYRGSNGQQPLYTHCGRGHVEIEVAHFFWQTTYWCARPGTHEIPQGDSQWAIYNAEFDGKSCY